MKHKKRKDKRKVRILTHNTKNTKHFIVILFILSQNKNLKTPNLTLCIYTFNVLMTFSNNISATCLLLRAN